MKRRARWIVAVAVIAALALVATGYIHHVSERRDVSERSRLYGVGGGYRCGNHLQKIGTALLIHARHHGGRYPMQLEDLVKPDLLQSVSLTCPFTTDTPASNTADLALSGHNSFVFRAAGRVASEIGADEIVVHEPLTNHAGEGAMALFGDGHVEWLTPIELTKISRDPTPSAATTPATWP
jgi:prepilin-type processing-associated H-X9-DG protein